MARLLHTELTHNHLALNDFYENPDRVLSPVLNTISTETWESVRVQMAGAMRADDLGSIVYYYLFLEQVKSMPSVIHGGSYTSGIQLIRDQLGVMKKQEPDATEIALAYSNLNGLLGWIRLRRKLSAHRKRVAEAGKAEIEAEPPTSEN